MVMTRKMALCLCALLFHLSSAVAQVTFKPSLNQTAPDEITDNLLGNDCQWLACLRSG